MKKLLFITFALTAIMFSSCKKEDNSSPANLSGTNWKCSDTGYPDEEEYILIKFTSNSIVETWYKYVGEPVLSKELTGTYSITGNVITFNFGDTPFTGVMEGKNISFAVDGEVLVFTKQ